MSLATLSQVLQPALKGGYAVAGVVCLGWEDMQSYVKAAELERSPVILQAGPGCREHIPMPVLAKMLRFLGENASVPVVVHLDHGYEAEECRIAILEGFTSVMFDGSEKSLSENIEKTAAVAQMAHDAGVSCEGEVGIVGYEGGAVSAGTDPQDAALFALHTGVDAMAVSVGNMHLQQYNKTQLDQNLLRAIQDVTNLPLVIHGGSGISAEQRFALAKTSNICKFNIGTELRMAFGMALRKAVNRDPERFDRNAILKETRPPLVETARMIMRGLGSSGRA